jgi:sugar lactone lactonase YvrE
MTMGKFLLVMLGVLFAPATGLAQTTLFGGVGRGSGENPGAILTLDQANGTATVIGQGASDPQAGVTGLAFDSAGRLFASTTNAPLMGGTPFSTLIRIDPLTGRQVALIGTIELEGTPLVINDLAIQPGTDVLFGTAINFGTTSNNLYTIDKTTAVATFIGDTGVIGATLAFGPDGTLYQTSAEFGDMGFLRGFLNTLDPATAAVLTTSMPFTEAHIGALAVRATDGVIFASSGMPGDIYTLSRDGVLTLVGNTGAGGPGDLAFTPVPTDKTQCKSGGWRTNFAFAFKNQGDCIQFVNTGK